MTNFDKWKLYTSIRESPDIYLEMGWLFCVSTALQRRVWEGHLGETALFPNLFIILIGPQALGKGQALKGISGLLNGHHFIPPNKTPEAYRAELGELPDLFCCGPHSTTMPKILEKLCSISNTRPFEYKDKNGETQIEMQSCMYFCLEELNSLFKRKGSHSNETDIVDFLLQGFDCVDIYRHELKTGVSSIVKNIWVNILAGTVPDYLIDLARLGLTTNGFMGRIIPVYADEPRFRRADQGEFTDEMQAAKDELTAWLLRLSKVAGPITRTPESVEFFTHWYDNIHLPMEKRASGNFAIYLSRKRVMAKKLAICHHFAESDTMTVGVDAYRKALATLDRVEEGLRKHYGSVGTNTDLEILTHIKSIFNNNKDRPVQLSEVIRSSEHLATADVVVRMLEHLEKAEEVKQVVTEIEGQHKMAYIKLCTH